MNLEFKGQYRKGSRHTTGERAEGTQQEVEAVGTQQGAGALGTQQGKGSGHTVGGEQCSIYVHFSIKFLQLLIIVLFKILISGQMWWCVSLVPALWRQRQVYHFEFEASLHYKVRSKTGGATQRRLYLKTKQNQTKHRSHTRIPKLPGPLFGIFLCTSWETYTLRDQGLQRQQLCYFLLLFLLYFDGVATVTILIQDLSKWLGQFSPFPETGSCCEVQHSFELRALLCLLCWPVLHQLDTSWSHLRGEHLNCEDHCGWSLGW